MKNPSSSLSLLTSALLLSMNANAGIISVTFDNQTTTPDFDTTELAGAPGVRVDNWNAWLKNDNTLGDEDQTIVDDSGTTIAGFQAAIDGAGWSQRGAISTNDTQMFRGIQDVGGSEIYTITGVPYATYDVYAYMHDDSSTRAGSFTIGSATYYVRGPGPSEGNGDPATDGTGYILSTDTTVDLSIPNDVSVDASIDQGNYVVFSGLTGSSFSLIAQAVDTSNAANRNKFAGFQIVESTGAPAGSWTGSGGDSNWTTAINWEGSTAPVPGTGEVLLFSGTTQTTNNNDFAAGSNFGQISFFNDAGAFTLGGNPVILNSATIIENNSGNDQVIDLSVSLPPGTQKTVNSGGRKVTFSTGVDFGNSRFFVGGSPGTFAFDAPSTGDGLSVGIFSLNSSSEAGVNTIMRANATGGIIELGDSQGLGGGGVQVNSPTLLQASTPLTGASAVGNTFILGSSNLEIAGSNDLELDGSTQNFQGVSGDTGMSAGAIISAGNSGQNRILTVSNSGATEISGKVYLNDSAFNNRTLFVPVLSTAGTTTISGVIEGHVTGGAGTFSSPSGSVTYQGDGTSAGSAGGMISVNGDNTYLGSTTISSGGYVRLGHANALGGVDVSPSVFMTDADWDIGTSEIRADEVTGIQIGSVASGAGIPVGATVTAIGEFSGGFYPVTISEAITASATYPTGVTFTTSADEEAATTIVGVSTENTGTLDLNGLTIAEPIVGLAGAGSSNMGTLINSSGTPATLTADVIGVSNSTLGGSGDITVPRLVGIGQTVTKIGAGTFTTNGAEPNSGTSWIVSEGLVVLANSSGLGADGDVTIDGVTAELTLSGANADLISDSSDVTIANGGTINLLTGVTETVATLTIDGAPKAAGTYGGPGSGADNIDMDGHFTGLGRLEVTTGGSGYASWAGGFPSLSDTNPELDFESDGLDTGIEWVLGGNPTVTDAASITPTSDNSDPADFQFIFRRTDEANNDPNTSIAVEYSSTMEAADWTAAQDGIDGVTITVDDDFFGAGIDRVTVAIPRTLAVDSKLFARLSVEIANL